MAKAYVEWFDDSQSSLEDYERYLEESGQNRAAVEELALVLNDKFGFPDEHGAQI